MPVTNKQITELKLTGVQQFALLRVGGLMTIEDTLDGGAVGVAKRARNTSSRDWYWAGVHNYWSENHQKDVVVRAKTFRALQKKKLLTLDGNLTSSNDFLKAKLTAFGWEVFDILAQRYQKARDDWDKKLDLLAAEEEKKGETYRVQLAAYRQVKVIKFRKASVTVDVIANSREEAEALAQKQFAEVDFDEQHWAPDWSGGPGNVWGEKEASRTSEKNYEVFKEKQEIRYVEPLRSVTPRRRAEQQLAKEDPPSKQIVGVRSYVKDGTRAPEVRQALVDGFGGRILDMDLDVKNSDEETLVTGADLNRFQFVMDDE